MIKHQVTMDNWSGNGTTWLWYSGLESELEALREQALAEYGSDRLEVGLPDRCDDQTNLRRDQSKFQVPFVFQRRDDAMRFKLSN